MMVWAAVGTIALALYISALATPLSNRVAVRLGMLDRPARHKAHARPTPALGGSAIFAAVLGPSLLALALARVWAATDVPPWLATRAPSLARHVTGAAARSPMALGLLGCAAALHVVGLIDDRKHLGAWTKLAAQVAVALIAAWALHVRVLTLAGPTISIAVSVVWLVVVTNAFNFLDNMDGLSAGVALVCCVALLAAAADMGQVFVGAWLCLLIGALGGFLPYNFAPARTFMGDAGSMTIGFLIGVVSCLTTYVPPDAERLIYGLFVPLVLLAVPLYDTVSVVILRLIAGSNPMIGDRRHFSHRLVRRGMSVRTAVVTIYLCTGATALGACLLPRVDMVGGALVLSQTIAVLAIIALLEAGGTSRGGPRG
ncbi:MAG: undecaprenyl/decaprenyl-phosphate alpha-N-acetylglucosaminyl 1-phosphate transferase [Phycisphaerae bacterium]|nr:undecaprenyl/decaprenyl-phosphate alpha-N-acetylglucosaminyl 1-phosphate transferase [Phycisphaerae bacterium]